MKPFFISLLIISIFAFGCKKKETYKDISDEYKSFFLFKAGSSWIYYNRNIHGNDSIVLRDINSVPTKPDNNCSKYRYEYKMQYTSVTTGRIFHSQTNCIESTDISDGLSSIMISAPPKSPTFHLDSLWVNNHKYLDVIAYQDTSPLHRVFVAYAVNIGRIKSFETLNGDTLADYEIVRYHVAPF